MSKQTPTDAERRRVQSLLESSQWTFAKTMPNNPHWYTLRKNWASDDEFREVVLFIRAHGYTQRFKSRSYTLLNLGQYKYWTMGDPIEPGSSLTDGRRNTILINRKPVDQE